MDTRDLEVKIATILDENLHIEFETNILSGTKDAFVAGKQESTVEILKMISTKLTSEQIRVKTNDALERMRKQYPSMTTGDIQTFVLAYQRCIEDFAL